MRGELYLLGGGQYILRIYSDFEMQNSENSKIFACGALNFNIHIFRFTMDAGLQVDIDFNTESKFSFPRSSFFSPLSGHSKPINYPFGWFRGPPKPSSQ